MRIHSWFVLAVALSAAGAATAQTSGGVTASAYPGRLSALTYVNLPNVQADTGAWLTRRDADHNVQRMRLAQKAAALINAGQCGEALKLADRADDAAMSERITTVCKAAAQ